MVTDYNTNPENLSLDHKLALAHLSRKLKEVLNPFVNEESGLYGIKIVTDIELPVTEIVSFHVNCFSSIERLDSKTIQAIGYVDFGNINQAPLILSNTGQERIAQVGVSSLDNKLIIVLSHEGKGSSEILKSEVEVFVSSNNRNHTVSIEYLTEDDYNSYASILTTVEETGTSGFSFSVNTGNESYSISNGSFGQEINKIAVAKEAETLHQDIPITVNQGIQDPDITGSGTIDGTTLEGSLSLEVNTDPIVQKVLEDFELPVATDSVLGGVNIANGYLFPSNQYPVQLKSVNLANYAYVDLNDFKDTLTVDKHRYEDMTDATTEHPNLGEVVLYIGPTTVNYTHGYFYMRVRELIQGTLEGNTNWKFTNPVTGQSTLNNSITTYNLISDHLLNVDYTLTLIPEVSTITSNTIDDSTVFNVVNNNFTDILTYGEIKDWGIELYTLTYDDQNPELFIATISLSYVNESNPPIWVLKNVQPAVHMSSALVYKGTCAWAELEGKIPISEPGYFYTVTDKSNQEYFFNGTITSNWEDSWEFMGDVFTLNGKYLIKTKVGSANPVIISEFEANQSDTTGVILVQGNNVTLTSDAANHTVEIAAIDTTYTASDFDIKDLSDTTNLRSTWSGKQDVITDGTGLIFNGTTLNHSNSITAGTAQGSATKTLSFGDTFDVPTVTYDSEGHITAKGTTTMTMPSDPNTDRYVNQANFVDDSANDSSNPVKMTLTRAGSDSVTVTANLPKVSSTSAGVAPKGAVVSTQSQTTKFLREDGTWATPSYTTNTDTQADWNETDTNSAAYINNKPTIPAAQVNADWNASSGISEILNKPSLATVATSGVYSDLSGTPSLAAVATSGSYNDLTNTPSIPAAQVNSDWNSTSGISEILNKPTLATVATSGAYSDLSGTPTLATVATSGSYTDLSNTPNLTTVAISGKYSDLTGIPTTTLLGPACMYPSNTNPYKEEWERSWVIEGPNISYGRGCYIYPKKHFDNMIICEGAANDGTSEKDERLRILVFPSDKYAANEKIRIRIGNDYSNHNVGIVLRAGSQQDEFYFLNELVNDKYIDVKLSNDTFPVTIDSNTTLTVRAIDLFSSGATYFTWDSTNSIWIGSDSYMTKLPELKILQHPV